MLNPHLGRTTATTTHVLQTGGTPLPGILRRTVRFLSSCVSPPTLRETPASPRKDRKDDLPREWVTIVTDDVKVQLDNIMARVWIFEIDPNAEVRSQRGPHAALPTLTTVPALHAQPGITVIFGPSGVGKSRLAAAAINHLKHGGIVFQHGGGLDYLTLKQNLALVRGSMSRKAFEEYVHSIFPEDATLLTRHPDELSGGQRRRFVIARGLIARPSHLWVDEPDAGLDVDRQEAIAQLICEKAEDSRIPIIVITHSARMAHYLKPNAIWVMRRLDPSKTKTVDQEWLCVIRVWAESANSAQGERPPPVTDTDIVALYRRWASATVLNTSLFQGDGK